MIQIHATCFPTARLRLQKLSSCHDLKTKKKNVELLGFLKQPPAHQKVPPECVLPRGAGENVYIKPLWCGLVRHAISSATICVGHLRDAKKPMSHVPMQLVCSDMRQYVHINWSLIYHDLSIYHVCWFHYLFLHLFFSITGLPGF